MTASATKPLAWPVDWKRSVKSVLPQWALNWREAQYYWRYGEIELHFLEFLCSIEKDSIDVGAHDGCYVHFLRKFSRHVYAFEPIPWMATDLERKFPHRVTVRTEALSSAAGTATLHMPSIDGHPIPGCSTISETASSIFSSSQDITVAVRTLDGVYAGDVGFIKIDVEGHELQVLEGAHETIDRCRPTLLVEALDRYSPGAVRGVAEFLERRRYEGFFLHRRGWLSIAEFDSASMQREEDYPDLTAPLAARDRVPAFVYNFIYLPAERSAAILPGLKDRAASL